MQAEINICEYKFRVSIARPKINIVHVMKGLFDIDRATRCIVHRARVAEQVIVCNHRAKISKFQNCGPALEGDHYSGSHDATAWLQQRANCACVPPYLAYEVS